MTKYNQVQVNYIESYFFFKKIWDDERNFSASSVFVLQQILASKRMNQGINKRSEFGHRTGTKDFRTGFYKGRERAKAGTMVQDRPTRPFVDSLGPMLTAQSLFCLILSTVFSCQLPPGRRRTAVKKSYENWGEQ